ncbi:hypothetical protein V6N12_032797 [Hibiscus sabdariffa]|uniref:RNase H type-1 domain-containing protein n=1 Tax=Hibiscus sabdariffa TaxID=183260 RepID=A0ABR2AQ95_9ROSI
MVVRHQHAQWIPPAPGVWKINVDGAHNPSDGSVSCGGVICNSTGLWISGFSKFNGNCTTLDTEFWAIYESLECALNLNAENIVVESDNLEVVRSLLNNGARGPYSSLFTSIMNLLRYQWHVEFRHVFREGNRVSDALAKLDSH